MIFKPKKTSFTKYQKGKAKNIINNYLTLKFFKKKSFYLKSTESGKISSKQLETLYQSLNKIIKKTGKIVLKVFPQIPLTKKPIEVRMGKGKGNVADWIAKIKAGSIICEIFSNFSSITLKALIYAKRKLPLKTKICHF